MTEANSIPYDIDGTLVFKLPFDPKNRMESSTDGRNWAKYMSSKRKGFEGKILRDHPKSTFGG